MSEEQHDSNAIEMTSETIARDLIAMLVGELKLLPDIWPRIGPDEQDDIIERVRKRVGDNVRKAVHLIASEGRVVVTGDLKKVTFSDKVEAVFTLGKNDPKAGELTHVQGQPCLIVVASAGQHMQGADELAAERQTSIPWLGDDSAASAIIKQAQRRSKNRPKSDGEAPPPDAAE
ncbi:hypothetical protein BZM27_12520 [Paraburkholderia steynii]|uniref:Uncharacterized protein n=1 Tax=Paraburkholderia steynii TaxID=1245441 RepID=A0A4R0XD69_9BURK|nr:hypothetical protein BZM27_12520 [Paraburkholderia steynii]